MTVMLGSVGNNIFKPKQLSHMLDWEREQHVPKEALTFLGERPHSRFWKVRQHLDF